MSAPYRVRGDADPAIWQAHVAATTACFGARTVWGSDWPHTAFAPHAQPAYGDLVADARAALGEQAFAALITKNAEPLYS